MANSPARSPEPTTRQGWMTWLRAVLGRLELTAVRITLAYIVLGMAALYLSDVFLPQYLTEPRLSQVQALKGGVEILLTGGFIFLLVRRSRRQVRTATEQVERQRDELSLLHRVFRHNLRNTLNVIRGHIDLAREQVEEETVARRCELVHTMSQEILEYTEQARRIRMVSESEAEPERFDLAETVAESLRDHPLVTEDVDLTVEVPADTEVRMNPMFIEALRELVTNALKHSESESPLLRIDLDPAGETSTSVCLRIRDNGPGLPPSELESLRAEREGQLLHATGMGLWFVDWVVTHSGGELRIETDNSTGTTVRLHLPKALQAPMDLPIPAPASAD